MSAHRRITTAPCEAVVARIVPISKSAGDRSYQYNAQRFGGDRDVIGVPHRDYRGHQEVQSVGRFAADMWTDSRGLVGEDPVDAGDDWDGPDFVEKVMGSMRVPDMGCCKGNRVFAVACGNTFVCGGVVHEVVPRAHPAVLVDRRTAGSVTVACPWVEHGLLGLRVSRVGAG